VTTKLILAAISGLLFAGHALAETAATPQKLNTIQWPLPLGWARAGPSRSRSIRSTSGTQVCGRYIGYAVVEIEKTENRDGALSCLPGSGLPRMAGLSGRRTGSRPSIPTDLRAERRAGRPAHRRRPNQHPYFDDGPERHLADAGNARPRAAQTLGKTLSKW